MIVLAGPVGHPLSRPAAQLGVPRRFDPSVAPISDFLRTGWRNPLLQHCPSRARSPDGRRYREPTLPRTRGAGLRFRRRARRPGRTCRSGRLRGRGLEVACPVAAGADVLVPVRSATGSRSPVIAPRPCSPVPAGRRVHRHPPPAGSAWGSELRRARRRRRHRRTAATVSSRAPSARRHRRRRGVRDRRVDPHDQPRARALDRRRRRHRAGARRQLPGPVLELPIRSSKEGVAWPYVEAPRQLVALGRRPSARVNGYSGFQPPD